MSRLRLSIQRCTTCQVAKPLDQFHLNKKRPCGRHTKCIPCRRKHCLDLYYKNRVLKDRPYQVSRANVIEKLGGSKCAHCGFADARALQIDHRHGGGSRHKKSFRSSHAYYKSILADPDRMEKYQILCANCNWIKRDTNNEISPRFPILESVA